MSRDVNGNYSLPAVINPVVAGTDITDEWANQTLSDIGAEITDSISRSGKGTPLIDIPFGGFGITGLRAGAAAGEAVRMEQVNALTAYPTIAAHATNSDIGNALADTVLLSGAATITAFPAAVAVGKVVRVKHGGIVTYTHSATLDCISSANVTTAAGDIVEWLYSATNTWTMLSFSRKTGAPLSTLLPDGTVGAPGIAFQSDPDNGFYRTGTNAWAAATGGGNSMSFATTGVTIPTLAVTTIKSGDGAVGAPAISFTSDTDNGFYRTGADAWSAAVGGAQILAFAAASITALQPIIHPAGTVGAPSMTFASDTTTGFYRVGASSIGVAIGGANIATFASSISIGVAATTAVNVLATDVSITAADDITIACNDQAAAAGNILIQAGDVTSGVVAGGSVTIEGGDGFGVGGAGGAIAITAGAAVAAALGGAVTITSGAGNGNQIGGTLALVGGQGGTTAVNGGPVTITGGLGGATGGSSNGGDVTISGGTCGASGSSAAGGDVFINGGPAAAAAGTGGGAVVISGGDASTAGGSAGGGKIDILAGDSFGAAAPNLTLRSGSVSGGIGAGDDGGDIILQTGTGSADGRISFNADTLEFMKWEGDKMGHQSVVEQAGKPTISSGAGSGATISGTDNGFRLVFGTGAGTSVVVTFGATWANAPMVCCNYGTSAIVVRAVSTTNQITFTFASAPASTGVLDVIVLGWLAT